MSKEVFGMTIRRVCEVSCIDVFARIADALNERTTLESHAREKDASGRT